MNGTIHSGLHRGCRASCEGLIFLGANIGNMTQAALKSSVEGGAIASIGNGLGGKITERFWGKIVTTQVKKRLAAVTGRPTRNQTAYRCRIPAPFFRRREFLCSGSLTRQ